MLLCYIISVITLTKMKYTGSIQSIYIWSILQVYVRHTSSILEACFSYTSTCWITEEEVYFKPILFWQKKYSRNTFFEIKCKLN